MSYHGSPDDWSVDQSERRRRIVHANDGSEVSFRALETALRLAEGWGATLRIIFVSEFLPQGDSLFDVGAERKRADRRLAQLKWRAESIASRFAVPHRTYSFTGHPVRSILQFVKEANADLLVIGAMRSRSLVDVILGRPDKRIARRAACRVLVVP